MMKNKLFDRTCSSELINQNPSLFRSFKFIFCNLKNTNVIFFDLLIKYVIFFHLCSFHELDLLSLPNYTNNGNIMSELYNCEILINIHKRLKIRVKLYVTKLI
jgi:hypothetical protein